MDKKRTKKSFFSSKKFKYGSAATVFTIFFIVAVILLNAIVSAVDEKYGLSFDLTEDQLFSISDDTVKLVKDQFDKYEKENGEKPSIKISFHTAKDRLMENEMSSWVVSLAESYAKTFSEIQIEYNEDLNSHPDKYLPYTQLGYNITTDAVIVSMDGGAFHYLTLDSCLVYDENNQYVWAFKGEMEFNGALIDITTTKKPIVSFTTGHGETVSQPLVEAFTKYGFEIEEVDLGKKDGVINPNSKILIMCNPQKDIVHSEKDSEVSEYTKISNYLNDYRSMIVIASPTTPELPVLDELLADWGMKLERNMVIKDDEFCHVNDNQMLYVDYAETDTVAAALTNSLTQYTTPPRTISPNSAPIRILSEGDGEVSIVEPVLTSSDNSYVEILTQEDGTKTEKGPFNLMTISTRFTYKENAKTYGHLLLIGSSDFVETNAFVEQFGNTNIVYNIIRLLGDEDIYMETHYKVLEKTTITMENGAVYMYGIVSAIVIPLVIFALGAVVYIKRKHK